MRLLLVEDDRRIALPTARALREAGHEVTLADSGATGLAEARAGHHDVWLLDVMLPDLDGFTVASRLRAEGQVTPIVFVTARAGIDDRVTGLDLGGDAYLVKPFALPELLATVRAVSRRAGSAASAQIEFGDGGVLDTSRRQASLHGEGVSLTAREYALLEVLVLSRGRWFTREELLDRVWGPEFGGETRIVDVYVSYLRRKFGPGTVLTMRGRGYSCP